MGEYLGFITIRNRYVNFKPLFEYVDDEFRRMTSYDRQALLPESQFEDINFNAYRLNSANHNIL